MDPLLAASAAMGAVAVALMARNLKASSKFSRPARPSGPLRVVVDGIEYEGYVYVAESLPDARGDYAARIVRLARTTGVNATFFSTLIKKRKDELVRELEREIQRAELAFNATGLARYRERLRFLEGLYSEVARSYVPYTAVVGVVVWVKASDPDARAEAEAFKTLLEAELGVPFRELGGVETVSDLASLPALLDPAGRAAWPPVPAAAEAGAGRGVVVGRLVQDPLMLVTMEWPRDFEAHMALVGPTGRGKTVLAAGLAAQLALRYGLNVAVVDPKGDLASLLSRVADEAGRPGEPPRGLVVYDYSGVPPRRRGEGAAATLAKLAEAAMDRRLAGPTVVFVDEAWRIASADPWPLEAIAREGRSLGLHMVYAVQSPSDIPPRVAENTRSMAVFGGPGQDYAAGVKSLGVSVDPDTLASMTVSEAVLKTPSRGQVAVRVLGFHKYLKPPLQAQTACTERGCH